MRFETSERLNREKKMRLFAKFLFFIAACSGLSGCLVTSVIGTAVSATTTVVGGAIKVVDAITPDILD